MLKIQKCSIHGRRPGWQAPHGRCYGYTDGDVRSENRAKQKAQKELVAYEKEIAKKKAEKAKVEKDKLKNKEAS